MTYVWFEIGNIEQLAFLRLLKGGRGPPRVAPLKRMAHMAPFGVQPGRACSVQKVANGSCAASATSSQRNTWRAALNPSVRLRAFHVPE